MGETTDEINQKQFEWTRRRLKALDKIEVKLLEMRELAVYAASRRCRVEKSETRNHREQK